MKLNKTLAALALTSSIILAGCGGDAPTESAEPVEVGGTFELAGRDGGTVTVSYDAFMWVDPGMAGGEENLGIAVFSVTNESGESVQLPAPIEGGGWHYIAPDGAIDSAMSLTQGLSLTYVGRVDPWHSGPFTSGTTEGGLVEEFVTAEHGGQLAHLNANGDVEATLVVPAETVNGDSEVLQEILTIADDFGGDIVLD